MMLGLVAGIIGGSGVVVEGKDCFSVDTPFGLVVNMCFMDTKQQVLFVNRHLCTNVTRNGEASYAPPHEVNYRAMVWALRYGV